MVDIVELCEVIGRTRERGYSVRYAVNGVCEGYKLRLMERDLDVEDVKGNASSLEMRGLEWMRSFLLKDYVSLAYGP